MSKYDTTIDMSLDTSVTRIIKMVGTKKKVLEFGCATGYMSKILKEDYQCSITGIEIDKDAAKNAKKYCERIIINDIETIDYKQILKNERFDVIIFADILEHLIHPDQILKTIFPSIADNGYILASIPNITHLSVVLELLGGQFEYKQLGLLDNTHLRFFSKNSILAMFRKSGYEITEWGRIIAKLENTEFKTILDRYPYSLSSFIGNDNESLTYQFIIKAIPASGKTDINLIKKEEEKSIIQKLMDKICELEEKNQILASKEHELEEKNQILASKEHELEEKNQILASKEHELEEKNQKLNNIYNSKSWAITEPLRKLKKLIHPQGRR